MADEIDTTVPTNTPFYVLEDLASFDKSRVILKDAVENEYKIGSQIVTTIISSGFYLNDDGVECILYIPCPPQNTFGVTWTYPFGKDAKDPDAEMHIQGAQIGYPLTSIKTVQNPTEPERNLMNVLIGLWEVGIEKGKEECENENTILPEPSKNSLLAVSNSKNPDWAKFMKYPFDYPKSEDKKTKDLTKPARMYVKLLSTGKGLKCKLTTPFYGKGDKKENAVKYLDVRGVITPVFRWDGVFWGPHGKTPCGGSLRFRVSEANFVAGGGASAQVPRILGKNTAPEDDEDMALKKPGEAEGFAEPGTGQAGKLFAKAASKEGKPPAPKGALAIAKAPAPTSKAAKPPAPKVPAKAVVPKTPAKADPPKPAVPKTIAKKPAAKPPAKPAPEPEDEEIVEDEDE